VISFNLSYARKDVVPNFFWKHFLWAGADAPLYKKKYKLNRTYIIRRAKEHGDRALNLKQEHCILFCRWA
jgi:hypothetical protein